MAARSVTRMHVEEQPCIEEPSKDCGCFQQRRQGPEDTWMHVGQGKGSYNKVEEVQYVGSGQGSYVQELVTTSDGIRLRPACVACSALLLLILLFTIGFYFVAVHRHPGPLSEGLHDATHVVYDCSSGADHHLWSPEQKAYCCYHAGRGCGHPAEHYDCDDGFDHWKTEWPPDQQRYCCYAHRRACKAKVVEDIKYVPVYHTRTVNKYIRQPPRYIYKTRYKTITKKKYVPVPVPTPSKPTVIVKHVVDHVPFPVNVEHVAKDATAADNDVGHVVQYTPASRPSHRTQSPFPYDCEAGHFTKQGWSRSKKQWCCFHFQKGCHLLQSCEAPCILPGQAGGEGTCASTTRWASANMFAGRNDACQLAFHQVAMNCHLCHSCQIHSTGCDLQEGFKIPHHVHRIHLLHVPSKGRTSKNDASQELQGTRPHEVHEHFSHALSHAAFRCDTTDGSTWSAAEALWCCSHRGMGCADSEK
ncbi:Ide [Symbiodinium sp. CCMP2592]|nr:Ide [Symbiodinium sp. CCMP2592]